MKKRKHSDTKDTCRAQCMNKNKSESRKGKKERKEERKRNAPHLGFGEGIPSKINLSDRCKINHYRVLIAPRNSHNFELKLLKNNFAKEQHFQLRNVRRH